MTSESESSQFFINLCCFAALALLTSCNSSRLQSCKNPKLSFKAQMERPKNANV